MTQTWIVRAGRDDAFEREAMRRGIVAMGWKRVGDLTTQKTQKAIKAVVDAAYPEYSASTRQVYAGQLLAFRVHMRAGDHIILLRSTRPDVAIGVLGGDYVYEPGAVGPHVRPVTWSRQDVRRGELGADLLQIPSLTNIFKVNRPDVEQRITALLSVDPPPPPAAVAPAGTAVENLRRNLEYARSLATAGTHLQQLQVEAFEVSDVFRAAWMQAVAALDHWVHQELHERLLVIADQPAAVKTRQFEKLQLPMAMVVRIAAHELTLREAVDLHWPDSFGRATFQQPGQIKDGLAHVADTSQLWPKVAVVLTERLSDGVQYEAKHIQERLTAVVVRRNKIAHENDEDPANPPHKREIDAASTMQTVDWIGQLVEAMVVVLSGPSSH